MEKQVFFNEVSCNFNLRNPHEIKPTVIYLVARINNKQLKLSTGVKVYPEHWDKKKQQAYITFKLSELDNKNNLIANKKIEELKLCFMDFKGYICCNPSKLFNAKEILKKFIYKDMATKNQKTGIILLREVFNAYHSKFDEDSGTIRTNRSRLNEFFKYIQN